MAILALMLVGLWLINACSKSSSSPTSTNGKYFRRVKTIIQNNCLTCHSSSGSWAGRPTAFDSDSAIATDYTVIKQAIAGPFTFFVHRMPQGGALSASDSITIVVGITMGGEQKINVLLVSSPFQLIFHNSYLKSFLLLCIKFLGVPMQGESFTLQKLR